jgi:two-component system CheB/CheR fusion protein
MESFEPSAQPNGDISRERSLYVVGIGASAGGLEAIEGFFDNMPTGSGMAFVVIQHLSPDFKSLMDEILSRRTKLPVRLVEDGMLVEPDHVYLIPPKNEMIIAEGRLLLSERGRDQDLSLPIDVFFRSLAQDCGSRGVAIVLSGGGSDGSRGIRAVHEAGGLVLVQDTETAQFDGMPRTARDVGVADRVLPPRDMPRALLEHVGRSSESGASSAGDQGDFGMDTVYRMLESEFGINFTHYKPSTVTRRIERRVQLARTENIDDYVRRLREDRDELDVLYRDLLIGVTRFFRNEEAFRVLEGQVLPELLQRAPSEPFRVWVAGCATGEEVYSIAILIHEAMQKLGERPVKIFATDVHRGSLELATRGLYDEHAVQNVTAERLERYFLRRGKSFQVLPDLRQMVVFAGHNVIKDAPFTRVDFVSCRNMLIYLQPAVQQKVLNLFHFALNKGGVMFLGPSESPGALIGDFETVDKHWRVYRKYSDVRTQVETRLRPPVRSAAARLGLSSLPENSALSRYSVSHLLATYDALLETFVPPSLLINDRRELVHAFGGASRYLQVRDGRQGLDVVEMITPELKAALLGALQRALKQSSPVVLKGVRLGEGAERRSHQITLRRVQHRGGTIPHVLITFETSEDSSAPISTELEFSELSREQVGALEAELIYTKENLQAATEELETSNEELQAANEELLASNEELQSTNEELQSVNEELYSVNAEYQRKIMDLTELGNDMENLLASTDIGAIFLDRQLRIRKYTPQIAETFNLMPHDVGRPIDAFSNTVDDAELGSDLKRVLSSGARVEREVRDREGRAFFLRILPYRAKGSIDGVVLTLIDASGLKAAEDALFHERYLLNSLLSSVPDAIYFKDARGRFIRANDAMAARLGLSSPKDAVGKTGFELPGQAGAAMLAVHQNDELVLVSGEAQHYRLEERVGQDGEGAWDLVTRLPLADVSGKVVGLIGIFRDVTEQKRAEGKIQEEVRRRDQFLAMLSHELRNPLGAVVAATALLRAEGANEERREKLLAILGRQSQQMARLLDDLLEVSRVTQDKIELKKRVIDIIPVLRDAVDAVRELMVSRGIEFSMSLPGEPVYLDGDPARLQQIHVNLLNNAAKYTPRGGHVELSLTRADARTAVVRVLDDGVGIPEAMLSTVFDLFVQSNRTLDRSEGGLGVGLTLVRGLVEKHGGSVTAASKGEGLGSEFEVRLPLATPPAARFESEPRPVVGHQTTGRRVVVVEDNPDSRLMLCELLKLAGFECETADSGKSGLALVERFHPHVALVDIGLPEIDGLEFARRIRANAMHHRMHLIALTGYGQREDRERVLEAGFDQHLVKPVDPSALIQLLGGSSLAPHPVLDGSAAV